jgi:hypothetical protein
LLLCVLGSTNSASLQTPLILCFKSAVNSCMVMACPVWTARTYNSFSNVVGYVYGGYLVWKDVGGMQRASRDVWFDEGWDGEEQWVGGQQFSISGNGAAVHRFLAARTQHLSCIYPIPGCFDGHLCATCFSTRCAGGSRWPAAAQAGSIRFRWGWDRMLLGKRC